MDNLTHTATGLFLARAGLGRGVSHAAWILVLAANAPDIDVVSLAGGPIQYLNWHRHATHALPLLPLIAILPVVVVRLCARKRLPWRRAFLISLAGVASHLALDLTNIYGLRLLAPFSAAWYRLDLTSVVDLWIWAVCLAALAAPALASLVSAEIGARRGSGRGFAVFGLLFLLLYNAARAGLHARAEAVLEARVYDGAAPLRVAALPLPANPFRWRGLVETPTYYALYDIDLLGEFDPVRGRRLFKPPPDAATAAAARTPLFQDYLRFAQYPLWRTTPVWEGRQATRVEAMDLRFGTPAQPGFVASALVDERGVSLRTAFHFGGAGPR